MEDSACSTVELLGLKPSKKVFPRFFTYFKSITILTDFQSIKFLELFRMATFCTKLFL